MDNEKIRKREDNQTMRDQYRIFSGFVMLLLALSLVLSQTGMAFAAGGSAETRESVSVRVTANPAGADVYVDGEFTGLTAPCTLLLSGGKHEISFRIPGYETFSSEINAEAGQETELEGKLLPELPEAVVITVNTEEDIVMDDESIRALTDGNLPEKMTLREALIAIGQYPSDVMCRIEFAEGVQRIVPENDPIFIDRGNLVINGDRDRDGVPDVTISGEKVGGLIFPPVSNLYLAGLTFHTSGALSFYNNEYKNEEEISENVWILGCEFTGLEGFTAFFGGWKVYGVTGAISFINMNICGCTITNGNLYTGFNGNCKNSVIDGYHICANQLVDTSIELLPADVHTWFGYYPREESGYPELGICENNIFRNILISGNTLRVTEATQKPQGIHLSAGNFGARNCKTENVMIRNNLISADENMDFAWKSSNSGIDILCSCTTESGEEVGGPDGYVAKLTDGMEHTDGNEMHDVIIRDNIIRTGFFCLGTIDAGEGRQCASHNKTYNILVENNEISCPITLYGYRGNEESGKCEDNHLHDVIIRGNLITNPAELSDTAVTILGSDISHNPESRFPENGENPEYSGSVYGITIENNTIQGYDRNLNVMENAGTYQVNVTVAPVMGNQ